MGHGFTDTHRVYDADGLALYFKAYLSDVEYEEEDNDEDTSKAGIVVKKVDGKDKKFIKGERLKYYPTGMPLFSASRGMKRPVEEKISDKEAMERVSDCKMVYRETYGLLTRIKGISLIRGTTRKRKVDVKTKQSDKFHSLKFYSWYPLIPVLTVFLLRQTR